MKRISFILCAALAASLTVSAQKSLVDEVKNEYKANSGAAQNALTKIQPALTNPESAALPYTWYTAGQVALAAYDHLRAMEGLNPAGLSTEQKTTAGKDINMAYTYLTKALPLDQVPNEKGKIKPKYTKDIYKALKENYHEFQRAGIYLYESGAYPEAVQAWETYITLPTAYPDAKITADPDSIVGQMIYYQGLAKAFDNNPAGGVENMRAAIKSGFKSPELYQNALAVATQAQDSVAMNEFAQAGYDLYGTQNIAFIGQLINDRLAKGEYAGCVDLVKQAIAANPGAETEAQLYDILGCIDADQDKLDSALDYFDKAVELNPNFAKGYFDQGRMIYNKASKLWDDASEDVRQSTLKPEILKAAALFEKAYGLDEVNMTQVPGILYRIYYLVEGEESPNTQKWHNM